MGIKSAVNKWMTEAFNNWVRTPIEKATVKYENQATAQFNTYSAKAKATAYQPVDCYWRQKTFYRGLFWIAVACLVVLWIISGS